jgi:hypothetical protein
MNWRERIERDSGTLHREPHACGTGKALPKQLASGNAHEFWLYLMSMPPGCDDADFERPLDRGRPIPELD